MKERRATAVWWGRAVRGAWSGVGRALSDVLRAFGEAESPRLHLVEITGEPGIGKTRFLAQLRQAARKHRVLSGRASELTGIVPFSVLVDAIDDELAALAAHRERIVGTESAALLAEVFPALAEAGSYAEQSADDRASVERYQTHRAIQDLITRLSAPRGVVVLTLDDMHWADAASMEFIAHLLRRPPAAPPCWWHSRTGRGNCHRHWPPRCEPGHRQTCGWTSARSA